MRPTRKAAVKAAAAVARPISPSPISSEEEDMDSESREMDMDEEDEIEEEDEQTNNLLDDDLESLSEQEDEEDMVEEEEEAPVIRKPRNNNKRKKPVIETDSEEDDFSDDLEILRNKPMTKRQKAKANQEIAEEYLELPMDTGKKKQLTEEEEQLRKSEVARRRKNQSIQRAEKDKADTINRLLKKQASKSKRIIEDPTEDKETPHEKLKRLEDPNRLRYINTSKGSSLSIPNVFTIEQIFGHHPSLPLMSTKKCQVEGCSKDRKYTAKKSGKYACSLEHYKIVESN